MILGDERANQGAPGPQKGWVRTLRAGLKVALVVALVFLAVDYYRRWMRPPLQPPQPDQIKIPADYYVYPPRSYVTDASSAKKLIGKPLWVKEGYRWTCQPGDGLLPPLEKVTPTAVRERGGEVLLEFQKDGEACAITIGSGRGFYVDEIFLLKDPRELYSHWPEETWAKIAEHQAEPGMTEHQIVFSRGAGNVVRSSSNQVTRIVDYTLGQAVGLAPVRVTYHEGVAQSVEPLPAM